MIGLWTCVLGQYVWKGAMLSAARNFHQGLRPHASGAGPLGPGDGHHSLTRGLGYHYAIMLVDKATRYQWEKGQGRDLQHHPKVVGRHRQHSDPASTPEPPDFLSKHAIMLQGNGHGQRCSQCDMDRGDQVVQVDPTTISWVRRRTPPSCACLSVKW